MKLKKKFLFAIPMFFATILGLLISTQDVKAEQYVGNAIWPSEHVPNVYIKKLKPDGTGKYQQGQFIRRSEDNAFVYCLQPFVDINNNYIYNVARSDYETYLNMTESQWDRISLLAYYGYGYGNHTSAKWYTITQVMIWRTAEPHSTIYFTDTLNGTRNDNLFAKEIAELESLVASHSRIPNFNANNITLPLGKTITLNDVNNVLSGFKVKEQSGVNASINGNSLSITATSVGNARIKLTKEDSKYPTPPVVYFAEGTQNVFRVGSYDPVVKFLDLKIVGGRVEITKKDADTGKIIPQGMASLKNAKYGVFNATTNEQVATLTTNENAYAISDYLPSLGKFYLKEILPSEGYQLDNQKYYFTIDENNLLVKVDVFEKVITRDYEITKVYASDKTQIMTPEVGVIFGIYDHNNNLVSKHTTDVEGKIYFTLPYGSYTLRQLTTTDYHEKIEDFKFQITELGPSINKVFSNAEITSRIKVVKVDQDGNVITKAGIKFKIKDLSTGKYVCQTVSYPTTQTICEYETDKNGILITPYPLNAGKYQLEELDQIVFGYVWNSTPLEFTIDENSNITSTEDFDAIIELKFENKEVKGSIEIKKTGEKLVIEDGKYTYVEIPLPNVVFEVYDKDMKLVGTITTDENGFGKLENLKLQKYFLKEVSSSLDNLLDEKLYEIELVYKDQYTPVIIHTFKLKNYLPKGTLEFTKTDFSTSEALPNTIIEIYTEDDELIGTYTTDENGMVVIKDLPLIKGKKYYILEKQTPDSSYLLNEEKMWFEITKNGEVIKANMTNKKIEMPKTFNTDLVSYAIFGGTALVGLGLILYAKKRKNK